MNTHTLTFPTFLPGNSARPTVGQGSRIPVWLQDLSRDVRAKLPARDLGSRAERRLLATAQRGRRIVLGTPAAPYEPLLLSGAPLAALRSFEDLDIVITTRSPEICEDLALLVELDARHAITVDMVIASDDPSSPDLAEQLRAVASLAAEGITARLVIGGLAKPKSKRRHHQISANLRRLFETARQSRVFDISASEPTDTAGGWEPLVQRLRLEYGFPSRLPGRG